MIEILENPNIQAAVRYEESKDALITQLADHLMSSKTWGDMNEKERKVCVRHLVSQAKSETDLRNLLTAKLGVGLVAINWFDVDEDKTAREAQALVKALGGLVAKNGALVMIMTADEQF